MSKVWCADNGRYGNGYPGDIAWYDWLTRISQSRGRCLFAVAPDVIGDAEKSLPYSLPFLSRIEALGLPAAFVAQDGQEYLPVPWSSFSVLFIGGTTEWKLGVGARYLVQQAARRGVWVHMGRVNGLGRLMYAASIGCDSADGTYISFGPYKNLQRMLRWVRMVNEKHPPKMHYLEVAA